MQVKRTHIMTNRLPRQEPSVHKVVTKMHTRAMLMFLEDSKY
jgi:hypothetical protein